MGRGGGLTLSQGFRGRGKMTRQGRNGEEIERGQHSSIKI